MNKRRRRVVLIVLDSVGVGALPDAHLYHDEGANTLLHVAQAAGRLALPNLERFGLGNIIELPGVRRQPKPEACFGSMAEASRGKDTVAGHWELMGIILDKAFSLFPDGFPDALINDFLDAAGFQAVLGNRSASGTAIVAELGKEHVQTGAPIVYTSADSVFQIAAHEEVVPIDALYKACACARAICDAYRIGRVIARPFIGDEGGYTRTANRKDFAMPPPGKTVPDVLTENNIPVVGIGKIENIFAGRGIMDSYPTKDNGHGMRELFKAISNYDHGLLFVNLIDFDMLYGHRNDAKGYAGAIEAFDRELGRLPAMLSDDDVLIITADHGCDPTWPGTDHTREYVPLLCWSARGEPRDLGVRTTFADVGATILDIFDLPSATPACKIPGTSFLQ